jgi:hypothetical protein
MDLDHVVVSPVDGTTEKSQLPSSHSNFYFEFGVDAR